MRWTTVQATVNSAGGAKPILLPSREAINRAVAGDLVVVELLPESEWRSPNEKVVDADGASPAPLALLALSRWY